MPDTPIMKWAGLSGEVYEFAAFPLPLDPSFGEMGNYIFTKHEKDAWQAVYIGQGDLDTRINEGQSDACIESKEASHVCVRVTPGGEDVRRAVEKDLLGQHTEAYVPVGCNIKEGG